MTGVTVEDIDILWLYNTLKKRKKNEEVYIPIGLYF